MMNKTTFSAAILVVLAGSLIGGCEMAPGTYTTMGTDEGPSGPSAGPGSPKARVASQPTARVAPGTNRNLTLDPISTSLVGAVPAQHDQAAYSAGGGAIERGAEPVRRGAVEVDDAGNE